MQGTRKSRKRWVWGLIVFMVGICPLSLAAADTYKIDPSHTYVLWRINHFGFSNPAGKWMIASGTITFDPKKPQKSQVNATIRIADMDTGIKELDDHLRGTLFFDALRYPTATFISQKVHVTGKNTAKVEGLLTLHGVTRPVTLDVILNKMGKNPVTDKETVGFSAVALLKRSDYGMNAFLPGLGDAVKLNIEAEAWR